jgi:glycosyltransferase involved in cell wall biosynthesis
MRLSLVIPCFNEAANLPALLQRCEQLASPGEIEVILVDNGSTDGSAEVMAELAPRHSGFRVVRVEQNQGYGNGILQGLRSAQGEILGWTHADMQTDPVDARRGLALFERYGDGIFVKGLRHGRPLGDVVFTVGMSGFESLLLGCRMWDINAQPTLFGRAFFDSWQNPPKDFSLDLFAYYSAKRANLAVHKFRVLFAKRLHGVSHWNVDWAAKRKFIRRTVGFSLQLRKSVKS